MPVPDLGETARRPAEGPRPTPGSSVAHYVNDFQCSIDAAGNVAMKLWHHSNGGDTEAITLAMPYQMFEAMLQIGPSVTEMYVQGLMERLQAMGGRIGVVPEEADMGAAKAAREAADNGGQ